MPTVLMIFLEDSVIDRRQEEYRDYTIIGYQVFEFRIQAGRFYGLFLARHHLADLHVNSSPISVVSRWRRS